MLIILPIAFLLLVVAGFVRSGCTWQTAILRATTVIGVVVTLSTELLSIILALARPALAVVWGIAVAGAYVWVIARNREYALHFNWPKRTLENLIAALILLASAVIIAIVTANALLTQERIVDVLTYHLPRARYWLQYETVAFFPTRSLPQLYMPPWTEYTAAQYLAFVGSERGVGLIQTAAMAGSAIAVSGIIRALGFGYFAQTIGAALSLTIPQGAMQAFDLKNDYVCAFWIASAVYFILSCTLQNGGIDILFAGTATALAMLTKGTAYLYALPFVILLAAAVVTRKPRYRLVIVFFAFLLPMIVLIGPFWTRNWRKFGSPLGCRSANCAVEGLYRFNNDAITPGTIVTNVLRNAGLHLGTADPDLNTVMEHAIVYLSRLAGGEVNDPRTTWYGTTFSVLPPVAIPDLMPNRWHFLLALLALLWMLFRWRHTQAQVRFYVLAVGAAALLFCVFLRWQPWHTRLHLPVFVLACPAVVAVFATSSRTLRGLAAVALLVFVPALTAVANQLRSFAPAPNWQRPVFGSRDDEGSKAAWQIRNWTGCRRVALDFADSPIPEGVALAHLEVGTGGPYVQHINLSESDNLDSYCAILCQPCSTHRRQLYLKAGFTELNRGQATVYFRTVLPALMEK